MGHFPSWLSLCEILELGTGSECMMVLPDLYASVLVLALSGHIKSQFLLLFLCVISPFDFPYVQRS